MQYKSRVASQIILAHIHVRQACLSITAALLFTGCSPSPPADYEFHTGEGRLLWRCNRRTGEVEFTSSGHGYWLRITNRTDQSMAGQAP